ncbi:hypothetical protein [Peribacillus acanthi]|nr:hypothetical protein [Peribacillus acanthi]
MQQAHGVGYSVYNRDLNVRMQVEDSRQKDYEKGHRIIQELNRRLHN